MKRNVSNTHFLTLSQTFIILLGEINVCPTTWVLFSKYRTYVDL